MTGNAEVNKTREQRKRGDNQVKVLLCGQNPRLPGGMAKYIGALTTYLEQVPNITLDYLDETSVKRRAGMDAASKLSSLSEGFRVLRTFQERLAQNRPDVAHLQVAFGLSVLEKSLMARAARRSGVPAIIHLHGSRLEKQLPAMSEVRRHWLNRSFAPPHRVVVLSDKMQRLAQEAWPAAAITVVPNAVTLMTPLPPFPTSPRVGFIGTLMGRKGECDLLEAVARSQDSSYEVIIAGDGPNRTEAEALTSRLGLQKRVRFLGVVDGMAKDIFFREISLLCLPSHAENLPISLLEAMAYGRPVIATEVGGVPEMIEDGKQGWLLAPGQVERLGTILNAAMEDIGEMQRRGERGWQRVAERYTWEAVGPQIEQLYHMLQQRETG